MSSLTVYQLSDPSTRSIRLTVVCNVHGVVQKLLTTDAALRAGELRPYIPDRCPKCGAESVLAWMDEQP